MIVAFYTLAALFALKLAWNILTPFVLARRSLRNTSGQPIGISMAPFVEIGLLVVLIVVATLSDGSGSLHNPGQVALWGIAAILGSYVVFSVLGVGLGWVIARIKRRRE